MDEIRDNHVDSSPKKRRIYMLFLLLGIVGGIALFAAIAFWYFKRVDVPPPKMPPPTGMLSIAVICVVGTAAWAAKEPRVWGWKARCRCEVIIDNVTKQLEDEGAKTLTSRLTS